MKIEIINQLKDAVKDAGYTNQKQLGKCVLAVSTTDNTKYAQVNFYTGQNFNQTWRQVEEELHPLKANSLVKIDNVINFQRKTRAQFEQELLAVERDNYWRKGIAFDDQFDAIFLEGEVNANAMLKPSKNHRVGKNSPELSIDYHAVHSYYKKRTGNRLTSKLAQQSYIWCFTTKAIFYDGQQILPLSNTGLTLGSRIHQDFRSDLNTAISAGENYLKNQITTNGKFIYGYYPALQLVLKNYNTVRHFSSIYALLEAIEFVDDTVAIPIIKKALDWGLANLTLEKDGALFAVDHLKNGTVEMKLGAQAMIILAVCKYEDITQDAEYEAVMKKVLAATHYFKLPDGGSVHVLNADLSVKDKFRIVYYEGEIAFALARYYQTTHSTDAKALLSKSLDFMVAHNYGRYHDHWISYAVNEALIIFGDNTDYMRLGIKNAFTYFDFIEKRDTAYPTLLELLDAANKMVDKVIHSGNEDLLNSVDIAKLRKLQEFRARHEIDTGTFLPEVAMYFYKPEKFIGGFFARHDRFRTRIDDCEHFLSGLINYYNYAFTE